MAVELKASAVVSKPIEEVYRFLTEPQGDTNWRRPNVLSSRSLTEGPLAVGSRHETVNRFLGKKETVQSEITAIQPPRLLSWKQINQGTFVITSGSYRLEPTDGATTVTIEMTGEGHGILKPFEKAFGRYQSNRVLPRFLRQLQAALA